MSQSSGPGPSGRHSYRPSHHADHHRRARRFAVRLRHRRDLRRDRFDQAEFRRAARSCRRCQRSVSKASPSPARCGVASSAARSAASLRTTLGRRGGLIVAGVLFFMSSLGSAWPESCHRRIGSLLTPLINVLLWFLNLFFDDAALLRVRRSASPTSSAIASSAAWASASPRCSRPCTSPRSHRLPSAARWSPTSRSRSSAASRCRTS